MEKKMTQHNILKKYCRLSTNQDNDRFVGIKGDTNGVFVYFPMGYQLSEKDSEIRKDILHLFGIINEFKEEKEGRVTWGTNNENKDVDFVYYLLNPYLSLNVFLM